MPKDRTDRTPGELSEEQKEQRSARMLKRELKKMARAQLHLREKVFTLHETLNAMHAAQQAGAPFAYPADLLPVVAMPGDDKDVLFLAFSGLNLALGMPHTEFLRSFEKRGLPGYFIKDFRQSWYQQGLLGLTGTPLETAEYLRGLVKQHGCKRLVTLGASSGGYAAILFGCWLGADRALAFSPQTKIDERIVAQFAAADTPEATDFLRLHPELHDLRAFLDTQATAPDITVYYGRDHSRDPEEAGRLEGHRKVTLKPVPDVQGHTVTSALKARRELDPILDALVSF